MSTPYYTDSGNTIHLGPQIGKGGEGIVYQIHGDKQNVAKIYINQQPSEVHQKILAMAANPPHDPTIHGPTKHHSMAWPLDVLYADRQKLQFAGFVMPSIDTKNFQKILGYINPQSRKQSFNGSFTWLHLHVTARNLASCIAAIHEKGYCIGDLNESNVLVQPSTPLTIIDCDSFQVRDANSGRVFRCTVGKPEYAAPEIMDSKYSDVDRTQETDCFAIGVMIFQLLMEGFHPYQAKGSLVDNAPNTRDKIKLGIFSYNTGLKGIDPPEYAPLFDILAPEIRALFIRCFDVGNKNPAVRPTAKEWMSALDKLANNFITCNSNKNHRYLSHMSACPWCSRLSKLGEQFHSFPSATGIGMQFKLPDPNNQMVSKQEREAFLLTFIEMALMDGYVTPEEESYLIDQGIKLHVTEKETKKLIADEIKRRGINLGTSGGPILRVDKTSFQYRDIKNGAIRNEIIEIGNIGDGVLTGTISANASWIKIAGSIAPSIKNQSQKIQLIVDTTNLPYGFSGTGTVSVRTNGSDATISVSLSTEGLSVLTEQFRRSYVPLIAACAGLVGSFSKSPILNFLIYVGLAGLIAYVLAKLAVRFFLNKGIDIFKLPRLLIQATAVGVVILTIISHSGGSAVFKNASSPARLPVLDKRPITPPINITKAVIAANLVGINQDPFGVDTSFPPGYKRLYYYVSYNGGIPDSIVLVSKWNRFGSQIREVQMTIKHASGIAWAYLDYDFQPGQYEVQIYANGQQLGRSPFNISDTQKAEEQQPSVANNKKEGESKYTDNGNGTIKDTITGLIWQKGENAAKFNWYQASGTYDETYNASSKDVCGSLSLAGSGWRLPTKDELFGLVDASFQPRINTTYFTGVHANYYWSSTTNAVSTNNAWFVHFYDGDVSNDNKAHSNYVRCVRGRQINSDTLRAEEHQRERKTEAGKANAAKETLAKGEAERQRQEQATKQREIDDYLSEGKRFFEKGKYELSVEKMREVVRRDNNNREAKQYIKMASEKINNIKRQFSNPTFGESE